MLRLIEWRPILAMSQGHQRFAGRRSGCQSHLRTATSGLVAVDCLFVTQKPAYLATNLYRLGRSTVRPATWGLTREMTIIALHNKFVAQYNLNVESNQNMESKRQSAAPKM